MSGAAFYAALICAALLLVAATVIRLIPPDPEYLRATFTPEHVELLNLFDNRAQQWAHRILVVLLGILALGLWLTRPKTFTSAPARCHGLLDYMARYGGIPLAIFYVLAVASDGRPLVGDQAVFHGRYALFPSLSVRTQLLLAAFGIACLYVWARIAPFHKLARTANTIALVGIVTYVAALVLFGVLRQPSFLGFTSGLVSGVEWHYSGAISSADRIGLGERLGDVPIHSSLAGSVLLGIWERANAVLDFGAHIRLLALLQGAMVLITAVAYGAWYGWRSGAWLIALLLTLPWMQPLQAAVLYPNQSSWRFFGLSIGVALLACAHARKKRFTTPLLGAAGGGALLWNAETGIALNFAYVVFLVLQSRSPGSPGWKSVPAYLAGVVATVLVFSAAVRAGLGYWPDLAAIARSFPLIGSFSKGYGGLPFTGVDPLASLVFVHALYLVVRSLLEWASGGEFSPRDCARIALAALLVIWAAYYFKAPHPWNLWSSLLIYGFLIGDLVATSPRGGHETSGWRLLLSPRTVILGPIVISAIVATNLMSIYSLAKAVRQQQCLEASVLSGICLPGDLADLIRSKAAVLRAEAVERPILYFSANSYLMPLTSGVWQPLRQRDAFADIVFALDFINLVANIRAADPACILYDDSSSPLSGYDAHRRFYARLRAALADRYERRSIEGGWEIHCSKSNR